jgi:hypothetical protein
MRFSAPLLVVALCLCQGEALVTFYVSPSGHDNATGTTPADPFATLARSLGAVQNSTPGDARILLMGGVFERTSATISSSTSAVGALTIAAYNDTGATAVLSGGALVQGWLPEPSASMSGLWSAPMPADVSECSTLYAGTDMLVRARSPDYGEYFIWNGTLCPDVKTWPCSEDAKWGFVYSGADIYPGLYDLTRVEVSVYGGWTASRHRISEVIAFNRTVLFQNPAGFPIGFWPNRDSEGGGRYFLDNVREGLDSPGEWYCDVPARKVLYLPRPGEDPSTMQLYLGMEVQTLTIQGADGVVMSGPGLALAHSAWTCDWAAKQVCDLQSTSWQNYSTIRVINSTSVTLACVDVSGAGGAAIWVDVGSSHVTVDSCYLHDLVAGGVRVAGAQTCANASVHDVTITNNNITRGGLVFPDGTGVLVAAASRINVSHNEVSFLSYTGISVGWCWNYNATDTGNHTISYNHVHDLGSGAQRQLGDAMACFYSLGALGETDVHHNLCHDVAAYYTGGFGTSQDQASSGWHFHDNIVARTTGAGQNQHYGLRNAFINNIFSESLYASATRNNNGTIRTFPQANLPNGYQSMRNIYYATDAAAGPMFNAGYPAWIDINPNASSGGPPGHQQWGYNFTSNLYYNRGLPHLDDEAAWGGCSGGCTPAEGSGFQLTFAQWQGGCGTDYASATPHGEICSPGVHRGPPQDSGSLYADPNFANASALNFSLPPNSPAHAIEFIPIDVSEVGPVACCACQLLLGCQPGPGL